MLKVRSGQSDVTRAAHAKSTDALRHRRFDARANGVLLVERFRMLPFSRCLQSLVLLLRPDRQESAWCPGLRVGTLHQARAFLTILGGEADLDDLVASIVKGRGPTDAGVSLRASRVFCLPVNHKMAGIKPLEHAGLPLVISSGGPMTSTP